jgi:hypothetical protein
MCGEFILFRQKSVTDHHTDDIEALKKAIAEVKESNDAQDKLIS